MVTDRSAVILKFWAERYYLGKTWSCNQHNVNMGEWLT